MDNQCSGHDNPDDLDFDIDVEPDQVPLSVADTALGKTRLLSRKCATCVFRPDDPMSLGPDQLRDLIHQARATSGYIICHNTLPYGSHPETTPAICRGFADSYHTQALHLIRQLWGFVEIEPPGETRETDTGC